MPPPRRASSARLGWIIVGALVVIVGLWYGMSRVMAAREAAREAAAERRAATAVLDALKGLQSVTTGGVNYPEYARRTLDTKVPVDRYLDGKKGNPIIKAGMRDAMDLYLLAALAWSQNITRPWATGFGVRVPGHLATDPRFHLCPAAERLRFNGGISEENYGGQEYNLAQSMPLIWQCASEKITAIEQAINAGPK